MKKAFLGALLVVTAIACPTVFAAEYYGGYNTGYANAAYANSGYTTYGNGTYGNTAYPANYAGGYNTGYTTAGYTEPYNAVPYNAVPYNGGYYAQPAPTYNQVQPITYGGGSYPPTQPPAAYTGGYARDPRSPAARRRAPSSYADTYEQVPVHQAFVSIMHRSVRLKKNTDRHPEAKYAPTSFAVGYIRTAGKLQLGAAFSFETGTRKLNYRNFAEYKLRTNISGASAFATYKPFADSTYVKGSMFLGIASYKARSLRFLGNSFGSGDSEHRGLFSMGFEVGHTWTLGGLFELTPHVGIDYSYVPTESYRWRNGRGDRLDSQSFWEFPLGVSVSKTFAFGSLLLTPRADLTLVTNLGNIDPKNAHPGFSYRIADSWKVVGASAGHVGARLTLGADARISDRMKFGLEYSYEGRSHYNDHRISANFGFSF